MTEPRTSARCRVAVAGGTGVTGRHVVAALIAAGHEPVVLARSTGVDVVSGRGLAAALADVDAVVDATNVQTLRAGASVRFFEAVTRSLLAARVPHLVALSIVGADAVRSGYYAGKLRQEELLLASGAPVTLLRVTQFHEFAGQLLDRGGRGPLTVVPRMRVQPVAAAEVGTELAQLAAGPPAGRVRDLAGPQVHELPDLARAVRAARGGGRPLLPVRLPGRSGRAMAEGGLLPGSDARRGTTTFDAWLAAGR